MATCLDTKPPYRALLYGDSGILRSRLGPWREVGIPEYSARDGEDDVKMRRDSSRLAQGVGETHRKRCGSQMFEAVALFLGAHAVLERRNDTLPVRWRREARQQSNVICHVPA